MKVLLKKKEDLVFNKSKEVENPNGNNCDFVYEMYEFLGKECEITIDNFYDFRAKYNDDNFGFNINCVERVTDWSKSSKKLREKFKEFRWKQEIEDICNET